jgi:hypothetical protein
LGTARPIESRVDRQDHTPPAPTLGRLRTFPEAFGGSPSPAKDGKRPKPPGWRVNLMRQSLGQAGGQVLAHTPRDYCEIVAKLFERFFAVPPLFDPEPGPEIMVSESADGVQSVGIETCYGLYISQWELLKRLLCKAARLGIRNRANADMVTQHLVALGSVLGWRSPDLVLAGSFGVAAARLLSRQRLWNGCGPTGATR